LFGAIAAAGVTGAAAGCTSDPEGSEMEQPSGVAINIGLISPALGPYSTIGADITKGFKLFLADHDNLIGRHRVSLKTAEEGATPESAVAAIKELLAQDVMALVGLANPASLRAVATVVNEAKVPLVSSGASPSGLTSPLFVWRAGYVEGEAGRALAPYAVSEGGRAYVLSDTTAAARAEAAEFISAFEDLRGTVVDSIEGSGNFGQRLQSARALGADVVFASYIGEDAEALLEAYRVSGIGARLIGPGSLTETVDMSKVGGYESNVYTAMYYAPDLDNEDNRRFVSSFHKQYDSQPSTFAMAAYDCASVLDKAFRVIDDEPTAERLNTAFSLLGQIESPRGTWAFNQNRTPQQKWYLRKLRLDGRLPANLLDADLAVLS
jgi:branched-chain amino acid transport system substrate-binding protein